MKRSACCAPIRWVVRNTQGETWRGVILLDNHIQLICIGLAQKPEALPGIIVINGRNSFDFTLRHGKRKITVKLKNCTGFFPHLIFSHPFHIVLISWQFLFGFVNIFLSWFDLFTTVMPRSHGMCTYSVGLRSNFCSVPLNEWFISCVVWADVHS